MSESRLTLKHPTGFYAAGVEMRDAMARLSDGGFKLYVYVCLNADRQTGQMRFRMAELATAIGHSTRSLTSYLEELRRTEVGLVYRAANQHEVGRIEISDRFWAYEKQGTVSMANPEEALYVARVRGLFVEKACVVAVFTAADEKLAAQWYRAGIALDQVQRAVLLGCARKYVTLFNHAAGEPVRSLQYFAGIVEEVGSMELNFNYWRYLELRVQKMEGQWRAQAKSARAGGSSKKKRDDVDGISRVVEHFPLTDDDHLLHNVFTGVAER